jgi:hypothetical protein
MEYFDQKDTGYWIIILPWLHYMATLALRIWLSHCHRRSLWDGLYSIITSPLHFHYFLLN